MGGLRVPDLPGAGPLNHLKDHQVTFNHTQKDPLEEQCLSSTRASFTVAIKRKIYLTTCPFFYGHNQWHPEKVSARMG